MTKMAKKSFLIAMRKSMDGLYDARYIADGQNKYLGDNTPPEKHPDLVKEIINIQVLLRSLTDKVKDHG